MSNLKTWLIERRSKFYSGDALKKNVDSFLNMVQANVEIHEYPDAIIVLEEYGLKGNVRGWLLFDKFTRGVVRAMKDVTDKFKGLSLYASTHDVRIRNLLLKMGYVQYAEDCNDYWLVKRRVNHGV